MAYCDVGCARLEYNVDGRCVVLAQPSAIQLGMHASLINNCARRDTPVAQALTIKLSQNGVRVRCQCHGFARVARVLLWLTICTLGASNCKDVRSSVAMSSARVDELRQRRADIKAQIQAVTRAQQSVRHGDRTHQRQWTLTKRSERIVLIAYTMADYNVDAAVSWLSLHSVKKGWPLKSTLNMARLVEDLFLAKDADLLAALTNGKAPADASALREAHAHVLEWRLHAWSENMCNAVGVALPTDDVLDKLREMMVEVPDWIQRCVGNAAEGSARKWASRWREKWGGVYGAIAHRDELTADEIAQKAGGQ